MAEYLTREQRAALEAQLAAEDGLSEEQAETAFQQGVRMAQADEQGAQAQKAWGREQEALRQAGFESVAQLAEAYQAASAAVRELRGMVEHLLEMERAMEAAASMDPVHPEYAVRGQVETGLRPMREQARRAARNRLIQQDWNDSAAQMEDLERLLPEMAEYILRHPKYADESDGLLRAYDAVRSAKYRDEERAMRDPEFIRRMAADERVREAVLRAHLEEVYRENEAPQSIGSGAQGGKIPLTGRKPITGMEMAKKRLEAMLK